MRNLKLSYAIPSVGLVIFSLAFHYTLIVHDSLLWRDDLVLISGVDRMSSLSAYFQTLLTGELFDLQPIRDLTFYLNLKLFHALGYGGFHLTNLLIAWLILYVFGDILRQQGIASRVVFCVCALLCFHPLFNTTAAWVSNRKHLLALLFLLLYFREDLKPMARSWKKTLCISLGLLSQPIISFMPLIYLGYKRIMKKTLLSGWDYFTVIFSLAILGINYWFYQTMPQFAGRNAVDEYSAQTGLYILKIFRVPVQILFPVSLAAEYDPGNPLGLFGIVLGVTIAYLFFKKAFSWERLWLSLIPLSTLFPVLRWGVRDPYLLVTLISFFFVLALLLKNINPRLLATGTLPLLILYAVGSFRFTKMWADDVTLTKTSYEIEGGSENLLRYAHTIAHRQPDLAYEVYNQVINLYPQKINPVVLVKRAIALYASTKFTDEEKLAEFRRNQLPDLFATFYHAKLLKKMGHTKEFENARKAINEALKTEANSRLLKYFVCEEYKEDCSDYVFYR